MEGRVLWRVFSGGDVDLKVHLFLLIPFLISSALTNSTCILAYDEDDAMQTQPTGVFVSPTPRKAKYGQRD